MRPKTRPSNGKQRRTREGKRKPVEQFDVWTAARLWVVDHPDLSNDTKTSVEGAIRSRSVKSVISICESSPAKGWDCFAILRQVAAFFSKNSSIKTDVDKRAAAIESFGAAERACE
jgi:hypothetical protein